LIKNAFNAEHACIVLALVFVMNITSANQFTDVEAQGTNNASSTLQAADSVTVLLDGKTISSKSFIHVYDSTPSLVSVGHVAAHLPCDAKGESPVKVVGGIAPNVSPLQMELVKELSVLGNICMYHADLPQKNNSKITDIALLNPSDRNITLPDTSSLVIHVSEFTAAKENHG
jgi:hypothetical protein